jgi:hypothetical protein
MPLSHVNFIKVLEIEVCEVDEESRSSESTPRQINVSDHSQNNTLENINEGFFLPDVELESHQTDCDHAI